MPLATPKRLQNLGNTHDRSKVQEKSVASKLGGRTTVGSGNKDEKGDVRVFRFARVECKNTKDSGYRVTAEAVRKIEQAALGCEEIPFMHVELEVGPDGKAGCSFCVVPEVFLEIMAEMAEVLRKK
jgi:hypothetical protein